MKARQIMTTKPHPLTPIVVEIARRVGCLDVAKLANELSGCAAFRGRRASGARKAYLYVAEDVLGCMHDDGHFIIDADGWYRLIEMSLESTP